jgi:uncharacterized protein (TIGR02145 family)
MKTQVLFLSILFAGFASINAQTTMNIYQSNGTVLQIPISSIDSITYTVSNPGNLAAITTLPISNTTITSSTSGGSISSTGGSSVTQRGVCWSISQNPTTANSTTNDGSGTGSFTSNLIGLTANTTYYVRAYAINSAGTAYGNELSFTTSSGGGGIVTNPGAGVTFSGYTYSSIVLGNGQEWMAENLRNTTYANGDPILNVQYGPQWISLTTGAWAHENNDSQNENPYGKLYNWFTIADSRNVCPTGWHVPSDSEWSTFINYLDPNADGGATTLNTAGGKLKSTGTQYWQSPNAYATNESGFSGLPGGFRGNAASFGYIGNRGYWWSSTENNTDDAWNRILSYSNNNATRSLSNKQYGLSVRCIRD